MRRCLFALLLTASGFVPVMTEAASCCGGGSASALVLPKFFSQMFDASAGFEQYHGFWNQQGDHVDDQPDSDLEQYRIALGYAHRFAPNWQASAVLPYVWNNNRYAGIQSSTRGFGDTTLGLWYEAFDDIKCVYKVTGIESFVPAVYLGATLTVPTGVSPYDSVDNSFDITGRGFYRLDANLLLDKTIYPWTLIVDLSYGKYLERPVNREYGHYVEPYRRQPGDRASATVSFGYTDFLKELDTVTYTIAYTDLKEKQGEINSAFDPTSGFEKQSMSFTVAYSTAEKDWIVKAGLSHAFTEDGGGRNFPATDVFTIGVSRVLP